LRYAALFEKLNDEAQNGAASDELRKAIALRTLIPLVEDFNPKAIEIESREKKYFIKGIESDSATIASLKEYNSRQRIALADSLSPSEINEIAKLKKNHFPQ